MSNFMTLWKKMLFFGSTVHKSYFFTPPKTLQCNEVYNLTYWAWMDMAHSPPKINSFCLNTVCNIPKLVSYKMMMAVVLSFRLNRTVKNRPNQTFCRTKVWSVATTQINSFCPNTVCNVPKLVHYKMMMAVVKCPH